MWSFYHVLIAVELFLDEMCKYCLVSVFLKSGARSIWLSAVISVPERDSIFHLIIPYGMNKCGRSAEMVGSISLGLNKLSIT